MRHDDTHEKHSEIRRHNWKTGRQGHKAVFPGQILNSMSYDLPSDPLNVCPG